MIRYLTKSRFKLALECETKLFYTEKEKIYPNKKIDDAFLESLAEGGFQVGELARQYHPEGYSIDDKGDKIPLEKTEELLKKDNVTIFEPAIKYKNLFIRVDVLKKSGKTMDLIEVKAKSFAGKDSLDFLNKKGAIRSGWRPYIYDVAFQKLVMQKAFPDHKIRAYLMLADKNKRATVDGLNQFFRIQKDSDRYTSVIPAEALTYDDLGDEILVKINVDDIIANIFSGEDFIEKPGMSFKEWVFFLSDKYESDIKISPQLGKKCKECEFKCSKEERSTGLKNGFQECWKEKLNWTDNDFEKPLMMDIWYFRRRDDMIEEGKYFMEDVTKDDLKYNIGSMPGFSRTERQWIQIQKAKNKDIAFELLLEELKEEMDSWKYPLHFIDFETSAVAIPFYKGFHPYEGIAFQFSHHQVSEDGIIEHKGEFLHTERGQFPNFEFVRALKKELEHDDGTIFRYHNHENTYLNIIYRQLYAAEETDVPDKAELMEWIKTITHSTGDSAEKWKGSRDMVDIYAIVKKYYYDPATNGSISLKYVLPAVLNSSQYLQQKYNKPVYGAENGIKSLNFKDKTWIIPDINGHIPSPYEQLPGLFEGASDEELAQFLSDRNLSDGGAAMMAYAHMQFTEISDYELNMLREGLLRYCELDTFAMVLIWEFLNNEVQNERD
ncbi:MAG: DUF2779 domain-containing protein [Candidatus Tenebribacter davisii]|nr:DUF2779 domain-containing protein [Candidatus Tenebribacter davisii]